MWSQHYIPSVDFYGSLKCTNALEVCTSLEATSKGLERTLFDQDSQIWIQYCCATTVPYQTVIRISKSIVLASSFPCFCFRSLLHIIPVQCFTSHFAALAARLALCLNDQLFLPACVSSSAAASNSLTHPSYACSRENLRRLWPCQRRMLTSEDRAFATVLLVLHSNTTLPFATASSPWREVTGLCKCLPLPGCGFASRGAGPGNSLLRMSR